MNVCNFNATLPVFGLIWRVTGVVILLLIITAAEATSFFLWFSWDDDGLLLSTSSVSTGVLIVGGSLCGVNTLDFSIYFFVCLFVVPGTEFLLVLVLVGGVALTTFSFFLYHFSENLVVSVQEVRLGCRP